MILWLFPLLLIWSATKVNGKDNGSGQEGNVGYFSSYQVEPKIAYQEPGKMRWNDGLYSADYHENHLLPEFIEDDEGGGSDDSDDEKSTLMSSTSSTSTTLPISLYSPSIFPSSIPKMDIQSVDAAQSFFVVKPYPNPKTKEKEKEKSPTSRLKQEIEAEVDKDIVLQSLRKVELDVQSSSPPPPKHRFGLLEQKDVKHPVGSKENSLGTKTVASQSFSVITTMRNGTTVFQRYEHENDRNGIGHGIGHGIGYGNHHGTSHRVNEPYTDISLDTLTNLPENHPTTNSENIKQNEKGEKGGKGEKGENEPTRLFRTRGQYGRKPFSSSPVVEETASPVKAMPRSFQEIASELNGEELSSELTATRPTSPLLQLFSTLSNVSTLVGKVDKMEKNGTLLEKNNKAANTENEHISKSANENESENESKSESKSKSKSNSSGFISSSFKLVESFLLPSQDSEISKSIGVRNTSLLENNCQYHGWVEEKEGNGYHEQNVREKMKAFQKYRDQDQNQNQNQNTINPTWKPRTLSGLSFCDNKMEGIVSINEDIYFISPTAQDLPGTSTSFNRLSFHTLTFQFSLNKKEEKSGENKKGNEKRNDQGLTTLTTLSVDNSITGPTTFDDSHDNQTTHTTTHTNENIHEGHSLCGTDTGNSSQQDRILSIFDHDALVQDQLERLKEMEAMLQREEESLKGLKGLNDRFIQNQNNQYSVPAPIPVSTSMPSSFSPFTTQTMDDKSERDVKGTDKFHQIFRDPKIQDQVEKIMSYFPVQDSASSFSALNGTTPTVPSPNVFYTNNFVSEFFDSIRERISNRNDERIPSPGNNDTGTGTSNSGNPSLHRLIDPRESTTKYIETHFVTDYKRFSSFQSAKLALRSAARIANLVDTLYSYNSFTPPLRVVLVGQTLVERPDGGPKVRLSAHPNAPSAFQVSDVEGFLENFLRWSNAIPSTRADAKVMLSGYPFAGKVVGMAMVGGVCTPAGGAVIQAIAQSTEAMISVIVAHEMGHIVSLKHDGDEETVNGIQCPTSGYIMAPSAPGPVSRFSECSKAQFANFLRKNTYALLCLSNVPQRIFSEGVCGNGIIESGEVCDCGGTHPSACDGIDACCDPQTCRLRSGPMYQCSFQQPCCTESCQIVDKSSAKLCREAKHPFCDRSEYCDGTTPDCPLDLYLEVGRGCSVEVRSNDTIEYLGTRESISSSLSSPLSSSLSSSSSAMEVLRTNNDLESRDTMMTSNINPSRFSLFETISTLMTSLTETSSSPKNSTSPSFARLVGMLSEYVSSKSSSSSSSLSSSDTDVDVDDDSTLDTINSFQKAGFELSSHEVGETTPKTRVNVAKYRGMCYQGSCISQDHWCMKAQRSIEGFGPYFEKESNWMACPDQLYTSDMCIAPLCTTYEDVVKSTRDVHSSMSMSMSMTTPPPTTPTSTSTSRPDVENVHNNRDHPSTIFNADSRGTFMSTMESSTSERTASLNINTPTKIPCFLPSFQNGTILAGPPSIPCLSSQGVCVGGECIDKKFIETPESPESVRWMHYIATLCVLLLGMLLLSWLFYACFTLCCGDPYQSFERMERQRQLQSQAQSNQRRPQNIPMRN